MARIKNGILGGFSGKVGTVVGYTLYGEPHMRGLPKPKKYTEQERVNQAKFKLVQQFLEPLKAILKVGFKDYYTKTGGFRAAVSYTRKVALVTDDAGFYIDPALFKFSGGDLPGTPDAAVVFQAPDQLQFTWDVSVSETARTTDQLMLLVYDTLNYKCIDRIFDGPFRKDGSLTIEVPNEFKGKDVEVYIGFVAADRSAQSDSQYLGKVSIP